MVLSYVLCKQRGVEFKEPPGSRDARVRESSLEEVVSELSIQG